MVRTYLFLTQAREQEECIACRRFHPCLGQKCVGLAERRFLLSRKHQARRGYTTSKSKKHTHLRTDLAVSSSTIRNRTLIIDFGFRGPTPKRQGRRQMRYG